jgi:PAS domain S-box-containing protein
MDVRKRQHPAEEAQEIVRALEGGEVDAVVVDQQGEHHVMALAKLTDLDEINELIRALRNGEIDAFLTNEDGSDQVYSLTPIQDVLSQQYYLTKAITDNATTALFIVDDEERCVFMNPAAEQLTGFTFAEMRDLTGTFHDIVHHTRSSATPHSPAECPVKEAFHSLSRTEGEGVFVHKEGHFYDVGFSASPIQDGAGQTFGTIIEVRDITERRRIERALVNADRRKDEFIATLAHELRNPLAPISNLLELMKQAEPNSDLFRNARETIERQMVKMVRLVDDLLDVSRISRNAIELKRAPVELTATINDVIEMLGPLIREQEHSLKLDLPAEPIYLDADAARLSQVLGNLVTNACKFTPKGGNIELKVTQANSDVVITVKDNGIGIHPEQLGNVFNMFARLQGPLTDNRGGLGIGLALAKQFVELHGGTIEARSDGEWAGSEFVVRLRSMAGAPQPAAKPKPADTLPGGHRILVVDDNLDSATSMSMLLSLAQNECATAHDGRHALDLAETFQPDLVLLDIGLPEMDGYEVCRSMRQQPWGKNIWIIAMTGWGQAEDRERSKAAGFNAHLVKPVSISKLTELMNEMPSRGLTAN